jgi:hypothetical protein
VVPRAWTIYFAEMAGVEVPDELPAAWIERAREEAEGQPIPERLSEESGDDPREDAESVARVVDDVRTTIFPIHGLT